MDLEKAGTLLGLEEKWLQPFDVVDPFSGLRLEGFLSLKPDHRYGALAILKVDERDAPQRILATPKLHYPFDRAGTFRFPPIRKIDIYEKIDGTNVLAYPFKDAENRWHITYKLRLYPVLRNGKWGHFLDMWKEMLVRYPQIPELPKINRCALSFELFGSRNALLMVYETPLECALLFGVEPDGRYRSIDELDCGDVPVPTHLGALKVGEDPVAAYGRIRERLQTTIQTREDDRLSGYEGAVWYVATANMERILFKCKPESVEAIHWKGGINKGAVMATCWNMLETEDIVAYGKLEQLLLEEYSQAEIDAFRDHIDACMAVINEELGFRDRVLEAYAQVGIKLSEDKARVMRRLSDQFPRAMMKKVYTLIVRYGTV
ncbi:MAG: hypothetical protein U5R49_06500 [Deltaproteobacteria bacterium]|nr:hypothetical protein [Deltaproteobacteria bacterium]